jgi:hypothetical protein
MNSPHYAKPDLPNVLSCWSIALASTPAQPLSARRVFNFASYLPIPPNCSPLNTCGRSPTNHSPLAVSLTLMNWRPFKPNVVTGCKTVPIWSVLPLISTGGPSLSPHDSIFGFGITYEAQDKCFKKHHLLPDLNSSYNTRLPNRVCRPHCLSSPCRAHPPLPHGKESPNVAQESPQWRSGAKGVLEWLIPNTDKCSLKQWA